MTIPPEFDAFARRATAGIDGHAQRLAARAEIVEHLLDIRDEEVAAGASEAEAITRALDRMGAADALVDPLEDAGTPRWRPWVIVVAALLALALILSIWLPFWLTYTQLPR